MQPLLTVKALLSKFHIETVTFLGTVLNSKLMFSLALTFKDDFLRSFS